MSSPLDQLDQLVRDVMEATGAQRPELFEDDAPVLAETTLHQAETQAVYLIGLIGGKEVGKSALVNALVGREITRSTSWGEGTQIVTAYAHRSQERFLTELLDREVPGRYTLSLHDQARLSRQVLLDLPDIDSHYQEHVEITRRMLRHMLFPLWIQSVEKYADLQPQELLRKVSAGNAATNFVFCLNKVDQLVDQEGPEAARELRDDYGRRLARVLNLAGPAPVFMISAVRPDLYDLPALRDLLGTQKSEEEVRESRQAAARQQEATVWGWIRRQNLPDRARRLAALEADAQDLLDDRLGAPLLEKGIPAMLDDPAHRLGILDDCLRRRCARWPVVNAIQGLVGPVAALFRRRLSLEVQATPDGPDAVVDAHLRLGGQALPAALQGAFAHLQQTQPLAGTLYAGRRLWETRPAEVAAGELARRLTDALSRQRAAIADRVAGRAGPVGNFFRVLLTIGALLWFPFVQPLAESLLADPGKASVQHVLGVLVKALSVSALLQTLSFLVLWFVILWLLVRWDTQRRIERQLARWKNADALDPDLSLPERTLAWMADLLAPIRQAREKIDKLIERAEKLRAAEEEEKAKAA